MATGKKLVFSVLHRMSLALRVDGCFSVAFLVIGRIFVICDRKKLNEIKIGLQQWIRVNEFEILDITLISFQNED